MMGTRQKIKTGAEQDLLTGWRHLLCYMRKARVKRSIKKQMARRRRHERISTDQ